MKKISIVFLFIIFLMSGCLKKIECNKKTKSTNYIREGWNFLANNKDFEKKNNLTLFSYGVNIDDTIETPVWHDIHGLKVSYDSYEKLDLNQARKKLIKCVHDYLDSINNN